MLLEPYSSPLNSVTKLVFRLPVEFGYPSIKALDASSMYGKDTYTID